MREWLKVKLRKLHQNQNNAKIIISWDGILHFWKIRIPKSSIFPIRVLQKFFKILGIYQCKHEYCFVQSGANGFDKIHENNTFGKLEFPSHLFFRSEFVKNSSRFLEITSANMGTIILSNQEPMALTKYMETTLLEN